MQLGKDGSCEASGRLFEASRQEIVAIEVENSGQIWVLLMDWLGKKTVNNSLLSKNARLYKYMQNTVINLKKSYRLMYINLDVGCDHFLL